MNEVTKTVDVLADAQAEIDAINARMENVQRDMARYSGDKSHFRAKLRRMAAEREEIGRKALAKVIP
jgi:predicted  nucleic acid-binding Zn-ribbon protein